MEILKQFKIHFLKEDYYTVIVFKTREELHAYRKELNSKGYATVKKFNFDAKCSVKNVVIGKHGEYGVILFWEESAKSINVVSHEIQHACLYWWLGRINQPFSKKIFHSKYALEVNKIADEHYATLVGNSNSAYWNEWLKTNQEVITGDGDIPFTPR